MRSVQIVSISRKASEKLILQLPLLGTVKSVEAERGFGFVRLQNHAEEIFFHVTASKPRVENLDDNLQVGDQICVAVGSNRRHPGRIQAVRWRRIEDIDWGSWPIPDSQSAFDSVELCSKVVYG